MKVSKKVWYQNAFKGRDHAILCKNPYSYINIGLEITSNTLKPNIVARACKKELGTNMP